VCGCVCVGVCVVQHVTRMRHIIVSTVACSDLQHFFLHYLINGTIFEKKNIEHKMCVLIFSTSSV